MNKCPGIIVLSSLVTFFFCHIISPHGSQAIMPENSVSLSHCSNICRLDRIDLIAIIKYLEGMKQRVGGKGDPLMLHNLKKMFYLSSPCLHHWEP